MRVVFAHDHIFTRSGEQYFSPGRLPYVAWRRYLAHFSEVRVLARVRDARDAHETAGMQRADGPGVSFAPLQAMRGPKRAFVGRRENRAAIRRAVQSSDALIARVPSEIGLSSMVAARSAGVPIACEVVASAWHSLWHHGALASKVYAPLLEWRTRSGVAGSQFALYVTRSYLQSRYPCRGVCSAASNVTVEPLSDALVKRLRRIEDRNDPMTIGFVGSLHAAYKGLDTALRALAFASASNVQLRLQIVGDGPTDGWRRDVERLGLSDCVEFLGALPGSAAVQAWLDGVDVYIHPSRAEGLPRSLIEAMSRGCLCFGSAVGGVPELLDLEFMHEPRDARSLAALLERAVDPAIRRAAAQRNIEVAASYAPDRLERIRYDFFRAFAQFAHGRPEQLQTAGVGS